MKIGIQGKMKRVMAMMLSFVLFSSMMEYSGLSLKTVNAQEETNTVSANSVNATVSSGNSGSNENTENTEESVSDNSKVSSNTIAPFSMAPAPLDLNEEGPVVNIEGNEIYALGYPIVIEAGETEGYTKIKYDDNQYVDLDPTENVAYEADLKDFDIYGGDGQLQFAGESSIIMNGGVVHNINGADAYIGKQSTVIVNAGTITGGVYGGGLCWSDDGEPETVNIEINGGRINDGVYGGGNQFNEDFSNVNVTISNCALQEKQ